VAEYLLTSERLGLRLLDDGDLENLKKLDLDPEVRAHFPGGVSTPGEIQEWISKSRTTFREKGFAVFAVIDLASGRFAGRAGFSQMEDGEVEVGYVLLPDFWGRGLAQESLQSLLIWAKRNINVPRIIAYAPKPHAASFNVMKKSGMTYFKSGTVEGVECDFYQYPL
jgi:ribosomal-protein-alanine N-acetyltransferase